MTPSTLNDDEARPSKRRKILVTPARVGLGWQHNQLLGVRQEAFDAVTSALHSAKQRLELQGGVKRLLAVRMRAVQSCLRLMIKNGMRMMEASKMAALASGFSAGWVSRSVRSWTQKYIKDRGLPSSRRGCHTKVSNVLDDPTVWAIIRSYLRSNKWSINPVKLRNFVNNELASKEAEAYAKEVMEVEMPTGLRQYIQDVILPRMQLKTKGKGFSLSAMRDLLLSEGFKYTKHKKALYFDGQERPDVIEDRQTRFLPAMAAIRPLLIKYEVGDVENHAKLEGGREISCSLCP